MEHLTTFFKSGLIFSFFKKKLKSFFSTGIHRTFGPGPGPDGSGLGPDGSGYPPNGSGLILN